MASLFLNTFNRKHSIELYFCSMLCSFRSLRAMKDEAKMTSETTETFNEKKIPLKVHAPDTWDEALAAFENGLYRRGRSEHTVTTYSYALKAFGNFYRDQLKKPGPSLGSLISICI